MSWQKHIDDLNKDDRLEVDIGDMLVIGHFKGFERRGDKTYMKLARRIDGKNHQKWVWTMEIQNLKVLDKAG